MCILMRGSFRLGSLLQITKLKIDCNPFAKGFRDSSRLTDFERLVSPIILLRACASFYDGDEFVIARAAALFPAGV